MLHYFNKRKYEQPDLVETMDDLRKEIDEEENASSSDDMSDSDDDDKDSDSKTEEDDASDVKDNESSPLESPSPAPPSEPSDPSPAADIKSPTVPSGIPQLERVTSPPSIVSRSKNTTDKSSMRSKERKRSFLRRPSKAPKKGGSGGGGAGLRDVAYKLKLSQLKISSKQMYRFATRIGRRLIRNEIFVNKLAEQLDDMPISETSEKKEERWGLEKDEGEADLRGYIKKYWVKHDLDPDQSTPTEWSSDDDPALAYIPGGGPKKPPRERPGSCKRLAMEKARTLDGARSSDRDFKMKQASRKAKRGVLSIAALSQKVEKEKKDKEDNEKKEKVLA